MRKKVLGEKKERMKAREEILLEKGRRGGKEVNNEIKAN